MMNDRELLELAAKAAGYGPYEWVLDSWMVERLHCWIGDCCVEWNPRNDSGEALELAAKLDLEITVMHGFGEVWCEDRYGIHRAITQMTDDRAQDYRNAITECAAMIGESMP